MKKKIFGIGMGVLGLMLNAFGQDHSMHDMSQSNSTIHYQVDEEFIIQLKAGYTAYLDLNKAFIEGIKDDVKVKATILDSAMDRVDMSLLEGESHMAWMKTKGAITSNIDKIIEADNIDEQRASYKDLSESLYSAIKSFGVGETVYYQYCPMAKSSWLDSKEEIANPYYGKSMLKCGSTKEVID